MFVRKWFADDYCRVSRVHVAMLMRLLKRLWRRRRMQRQMQRRGFPDEVVVVVVVPS
jgi:hypothetical protein